MKSEKFATATICHLFPHKCGSKFFTFHFSLLLFSFSFLASYAQCPTENKAFKAGESLTYDLYFNWKFV